MPSEICLSRVDSATSEQRRGQRLVVKLSESALFKEYQAAFRGATGLSLALRPVQSFKQGDGSLGQNSLCRIVSEATQGCVSCLAVRESLERQAVLKPKSVRCFVGLCDSAVPVRVGDGLIGYLHTGQILLHEPNREEFDQAVQQLHDWGASVDFEALETAYFNTQVIRPEQYDSMLRLLAMFAEHLAVISNSIEIKDQEDEPKLVSQAKCYIQEHYSERISLDEAAQAVNASTRHFCKVFKASTGMTFTDYLARVRVEQAKLLLGNPHLRVSEIAFETGFESISQFNRSFKRIAGHSPTQFREA
ncbi:MULTISPECIES: helix-turn-helix domain-containing protein [unclassified Lentimonas]|uniref:helix-turn-helix domain-containing protein n=1 Tax=unclassified Lentimonas TaxID=2630993 RepID=UPI00132279C1|nr:MULTISPECIES: helix-turn-helix domain-containing protein [unclassified Lentimonas]CAA6679122.1 transcriptional regulator [Lentimonas sp. CC4]CAA6684134.1 transcriptional regulator [Lentimonas sp. CC6]CAA6694461.1 transcriptional regulator [Lentimonas sp. CC19]CAA6697100.1 transcriptional regulator [Lentimonas sp. CC10]CAA7069548.1 transcriptional regulator [Lentimonas sp. CC11]